MLIDQSAFTKISPCVRMRQRERGFRMYEEAPGFLPAPRVRMSFYPDGKSWPDDRSSCYFSMTPLAFLRARR
jgi:hypothetical protein